MIDAVACAERGPHPVGVITLEIEDAGTPGRSLPTDVWYPADATNRDRTPDADHPFGQVHAAIVGARPASELSPLLAFSHGNSGLRRQSTFLTTHLASWGFVVVAPDHMGNTFPEMLLLDAEQRKAVHLEARRNRPRDLLAAVATVRRGGEGLPRVAPGRLGVLGHSFGGWTATKMPALANDVAAVCGLAPASEPFVGRKAFEPGELPFRDGVASLIVAGAEDVLVDLETSVRPLSERLAAPHELVVVEGMDHFHFCDGIEMLHGNHQRMVREGLPRPVKPLAELLEEARTHRIVRGVVAAFFRGVFAGEAVGRVGELDAAIR